LQASCRASCRATSSEGISLSLGLSETASRRASKIWSGFVFARTVAVARAAPPFHWLVGILAYERPVEVHLSCLAQ